LKFLFLIPPRLQEVDVLLRVGPLSDWGQCWRAKRRLPTPGFEVLPLVFDGGKGSDLVLLGGVSVDKKEKCADILLPCDYYARGVL